LGVLGKFFGGIDLDIFLEEISKDKEKIKQILFKSQFFSRRIT
jgi:hypothetical protein